MNSLKKTHLDEVNKLLINKNETKNYVFLYATKMRRYFTIRMHGTKLLVHVADDYFGLYLHLYVSYIYVRRNIL